MGNDRQPNKGTSLKGTGRNASPPAHRRSDLSRSQQGRPLSEKRGGYPGTTPVEQMKPPPDNLAPGAEARRGQISERGSLDSQNDPHAASAGQGLSASRRSSSRGTQTA